MRCRAPGFGQQALALFQQVGDVLATEGLELQGVLDGPGGHLGAVNLAQGDDLADVVQDVEPPLGQPLVERFGLGGRGSAAGQQLLIAGPAALLEQGPRMIGVLEVLVTVVAADVAGDELVLMVEAQMIGIELEGQGGPGVFGGDRIGVGVHRDAELAVGPCRQDDADVVGLVAAGA